MQTSAIELVDRGERQDTKGRTIVSREERERLLAAYDDSGLTQRAFARREGIKESTFIWWLKQRRERGQGSKAVRFAEYRVGPAQAGLPMEVVLPDGTQIRGSDTTALMELVKALRA